MTAGGGTAFGSLMCLDGEAGGGPAVAPCYLSSWQKSGKQELELITRGSPLPDPVLRLEAEPAGEVEAHPHRCQQLGPQLHSMGPAADFSTLQNMLQSIQKVLFPSGAHMGS